MDPRIENCSWRYVFSLAKGIRHVLDELKISVLTFHRLWRLA